MSLINEMLRNLDARQSPTPGSDDGVVVTRESPSKNRSYLVYLLVAVVVALGSVLLLHEQGLLQSEQPPKLTAGPATTQKSTAAKTVPAPVVNRKAEPTNQTKSSLKAPVRNEPPPASTINDAEKTTAEAETATPAPFAAREISTEVRREVAPQPLVRKILETPSNYYAVQLVALSNEQNVLDFAEEVGIRDPLHAPMLIGRRQAHVLLLGVYPTYVSAATARDSWMKGKDASINTWVRPIRPLQEAIAGANPGQAFSTTASTSSNKPLSDRDRKVQILLEEAEEALIQERLTEPKGNNAYEKYRQVLRLSPSQPVALAGIEQIVSQYLRLANEYIDENNLERARLLAERARYVDGESARILQLEHRINAGDDTIKNDPPEQLNQPIVTRPKRRTEEEVLAEAREMLSRNAQLPARNLLEQYLVSDPESIATVRALCGLYLQMGDTAMANNLLNSTPGLPALTTLELSARIQAQQGDLEGAILMLEAVRPGFHETSYYALRANLYQQTARYSEAASLYRRLLDDEPNNSAFWLGLAVSLDALNSTTEALNAFEETLASGQYEGEVLNYVQERIAALSK